MKSTTNQTQSTPVESLTEAELDERRRIVAYQLWEDEGRPEGKAEEHWSRASAIVMKTDLGAAAEGTPEWLQRKAIEAQASKQPQPDAGSPAVEAPLDAIRRKLAERKTA